MARTKPTSSSAEQSSNTGTGGELHQQPTNGGTLLTTNQGVVVADNQNSLKAAPRGPTLLEDFILREKITHFDHERIPERVVHARGSGAHGFFQLTQSLSQYTKADFLQRVGDKTPVFVRFSTVAGGAGSGDLPRDVRGFATKFYTRQGNFDLVGNNIPVFFIQDAMKFPDLVHSVKMEPDRLSAGGLRTRHVLGLRVADAGKHAHDHVGDVGSCAPAVTAHDRRIWCQYLSPRRCQRQTDLCQVPLAAEARHAIGNLGRSRKDQW